MTSLSTLLTTGYCQTIKVGEIVKLYRDLISSSVPTHGKIQYSSPNTYSLTNYFRAVDCDNLEIIRTFKVYSLKGKDDSSCESGQCIGSVRCVSGMLGFSELASETSLNGRYLARLKSLPGRDGSTRKQVLEIWDRHTLLKSLDTSELVAHGSINTDGHFSRLVWSPFGEQDKLLYVCQPKRPKSMSFFKQPSTSDKSDTNRGEEFLKRDNWGERLVDIEHTIIAVLDVASDCCITTIQVEGHSLGTPQWIENGTKIVSVAYREIPRFPGILHSNNRVSRIMVHDWKSCDLILKLENDSECFHSPRVNNAGNKFLYCKNEAYGTSFHTVELRIYDMETRRDKLMADGLFIVKIPNNCFTSDDKHVLFVKADHLHHHMCLVNLEKLTISKINFPTTGLSIMDFRHDIILASGSEPNVTPAPFVAKLCLSSLDNFVNWEQIEESKHFDELDYETFKIPIPGDQSSNFVSAILVKPNAKALRRNLKIGGTNLPTVVRVHGGPASAYHVCYSPDYVLYAKLGLQTLLINYRGSTGVSEKYTESLHGLVGKQDVDDCLHVLRHFVREKLIDPNRLIIQGHSHGGFLSCHLSCQEEFKFTSAIILNPVVDLPAMFDASCLAGYVYTVNLNRKEYHSSWLGPSGQELVRLFERSPISKSSKANVPTLMFLGSQDKLVPMSQGQRWVDVLGARGVETLCKVYADGHSLSRPENLADSVITSLIWILNHFPKC